MAQYFLNCLECAQSLDIQEGEELDFSFDPLPEVGDTMSLAGFLVLHRGHPLMFTTKE